MGLAGSPGVIKQQSQKRSLPTEVATAIITSYYSRGVAAADRARDRADKGYTIASAIAASLVAAGVFTHLDKRQGWVQATGLTALGLWLLAALLFIYAVSLPVSQKDDDDPPWTDEVEFADGVAEQVDAEVKTLRQRLLAAVAVTVCATAVTLVALSLGTALAAPSTTERERIVLTPKGDADLAKLCKNSVADVWGILDPGTLKDPVVSLALPAKECNAGKTTVHLPKADIAATEKVSVFPKFRR